MIFSKGQLTALVLLRVLIGWHFLHEGLTKLIDPYWSAAGYLLESGWIFAGFFRALASHSTILAVVDILNIWGLIIIGVLLIAGVFGRWTALTGMVLLLLYYLAHPPLIGFESALPREGSYLIVNKNLIEAAALLVFALFPTGHIIGLDKLLFKIKPFA